MPFPLTEEQRKIVDDRGGELLVSAAAGSGKTRVLVERLLDRVTREGIDIDRFLVITYTKAAAAELRGMRNAALISAGSDGTDGPTDAAGGYVDGGTFDTLLEKGIRLADALQNNDSYHALEAAGGLIKTGPTGTNVNDVAVALLDCG